MLTLFHNAALWWPALVLFQLLGCGASADSKLRATQNSGADALPANAIRMERESLTGEKASLEAYRGKVVVVTYFATWCVPCQRLVPVIDRLAHGTQAIPGFVSLPISVDRRPKSVLPTFVQTQRLRGVFGLGNRAERRGRTPFGRIDGLPTTFLIDSQGIPVEKLVGEVPAAYLRRRIATLLEEQK